LQTVLNIADIERRVAELRQLRRTLDTYRTACERALGRAGEPACPTLNALDAGGSKQDVRHA